MSYIRVQTTIEERIGIHGNRYRKKIQRNLGVSIVTKTLI